MVRPWTERELQAYHQLLGPGESRGLPGERSQLAFTNAPLFSPAAASSAGCPSSSPSSTTPTSRPLEAWTPAASAPASAPPPAPVTDTCHPLSELWSQACEGGRPGAGASPRQNHTEQRPLLREHCRLWLWSSWRHGWPCGAAQMARGPQDGGHLAPTSRLICEVFILSQRRGMKMTSSFMSAKEEQLGYLKLCRKKKNPRQGESRYNSS